MNCPDESILVAVECITYNQESYIRQCLDGFVTQETNFKFVAIVHDDASTDKTADIIREYELRYPEIIRPIYEIENQYSKQDGSLRRIMDAAINATGAKYVAFCEGDDYWTDPNKLQKQVEYMETHPDCSLCFHAYESVYSDSSLNHNTYPKFKSKDGIYRMGKLIAVGSGTIATNSMLYKTSDYKSMPSWFKHYHIGDLPLLLWLGSRGYAYYSNEVMSAYRISSTGSWTVKRNALGIIPTIRNYFKDCKMWWDFVRWQRGHYLWAFAYRYAMITYVLLRHICKIILHKKN